MIQGTLKERSEYHRNMARRSDARRRLIYQKLLRWVRRNRPALLQTIRKQARKEIPRIYESK